MISDYSTVLLDTRDQVMFLTRPIEKKSLISRSIHTYFLAMYLFYFLELSLPSIVVIGIRFGIGAGALLF